MADDSVMMLSWTKEDVISKINELGLSLEDEEIDTFISENSEEILEVAQLAGVEKMEELLLNAFPDQVDAFSGEDSD